MSASSDVATPASRRAYLDHASTSPLRPAASEAMARWSSAADPGRVHAEGRLARAALEEAREEVASFVGTRPRQVVFTSGGTESVNAATFAALWEGGDAPRGRAALAAVEHSAVRDATARWAGSSATVAVDRTGRIDLAALEETLDASPVRLVHCQAANHEVGTLQPLEQVAELCRRHSALLHVDASAAAGMLPIRFDELGADLLSLSSHKIGGPRGFGALLVRRGRRFPALLLGGAQERARRGGLEDVASAAGFAAVCASLRAGGLEAEAAAARRLTDRIRDGLGALGGIEIYGPSTPADRLAHLVCLGVSGIEAEPVLVGLDQAGIAAHSGSSCSSEMLEPSAVLEAMGVDAEHSLRLSVGWSTDEAEVDLALGALPAVLRRLEDLRSPGGPATP